MKADNGASIHEITTHTQRIRVVSCGVVPRVCVGACLVRNCGEHEIMLHKFRVCMHTNWSSCFACLLRSMAQRVARITLPFGGALATSHIATWKVCV